MDILFWLLPPVVVTALAMVWVGWLGREGRGEIDREEAARRVGVALERDRRPRSATRSSTVVASGHSSGVVIRRPVPAVPPVAPVVPVVAPAAAVVQLPVEQPVELPAQPVGEPHPGDVRRAS